MDAAHHLVLPRGRPGAAEHLCRTLLGSLWHAAAARVPGDRNTVREGGAGWPRVQRFPNRLPDRQRGTRGNPVRRWAQDEAQYAQNRAVACGGAGHGWSRDHGWHRLHHVRLASPPPSPYSAWVVALLIGAILAPTDAAAVAVLLRRARLAIPKREGGSMANSPRWRMSRNRAFPGCLPLERAHGGSQSW